VRALLVGGLHLAALSAFAVAQPLFDLLARNSAFLAVRGLTSGEIVAFALGAILLPPALLLAVEALAALLGPRVRLAVHLVFVGLLTGLVALQALDRIDWPGRVLLGAALLLGVLAALAYARFAPLRSVLTVLSPAPLLFLALFLFFSPVSKLVLPGDEDAQAARIDSPAPVVVVVFDEFSTTSLLDGDRRLDAVRYPGFAELARDATWFRNATTVSPWTEQAVPAILSGRVPDDDSLPIVGDYPQNLFTLLGDSYDLHVQEPITSLCPRGLCPETGPRSIPPGVRPLLSDTGIVYLHLLLPEDLTGWLPAVSNRWGNFRGARALVGVDRRQRSASANFDDFLASLEPGARPGLHFLHVLLPHFPYQFMPSGKRYGLRNEAMPGLDGEDWGPSERLVFQGRQRYLLQVGFVDRLVGRLVERLRETGLYDRSLVVVTADHGVSHRAGGKLRTAGPANAQDIAFVPLFVKLPSQAEGGVNDAPVRIVDILPTIAAGLGAELPARVDGRSLFRGGSSAGPGEVEIEGETYALRDLYDGQAEVLRERIATFGARGPWSRVFRGGPYRELVGRPVTGFGTVSSEDRVEIDDADFFRDVDTRSSLLPANVRGLLRGPGARAGLELAVALNGRIEAIAPTYEQDGEVRFAGLVPDSAFRPGRNGVAVYRLERAGGQTVLASLGGSSGGPTFALEATPAGEVIRSSGGSAIRVVPGAVQGAFDAADVESSELRLSGWAADVRRTRPRERVVVFAAGHFVASSSTRVERPDLGGGIARSGFDLRLPLERVVGSGPGPTKVRVFGVVGGVASELSCTQTPGPGGPRPGYRLVRVGPSAAAQPVTLLLPAVCRARGTAVPPSRAGSPELLVTEAEIGRYGPGGPARALMAWWRAAQLGDRRGYLARLSPPVRRSVARDPNTPRALAFLARALRFARPTELRVERSGTAATVFARVRIHQGTGQGKFTTTDVPRAFELVSRNGRWLLRDDFYVQSTLPPSLRRG
jgi:hypothetical protein